MASSQISQADGPAPDEQYPAWRIDKEIHLKCIEYNISVTHADNRPSLVEKLRDAKVPYDPNFFTKKVTPRKVVIQKTQGLITPTATSASTPEPSIPAAGTGAGNPAPSKAASIPPAPGPVETPSMKGAERLHSGADATDEVGESTTSAVADNDRVAGGSSVHAAGASRSGGNGSGVDPSDAAKEAAPAASGGEHGGASSGLHGPDATGRQIAEVEDAAPTEGTTEIGDTSSGLAGSNADAGQATATVEEAPAMGPSGTGSEIGHPGTAIEQATVNAEEAAPTTGGSEPSWTASGLDPSHATTDYQAALTLGIPENAKGPSNTGQANTNCGQDAEAATAAAAAAASAAAVTAGAPDPETETFSATANNEAAGQPGPIAAYDALARFSKQQKPPRSSGGNEVEIDDPEEPGKKVKGCAMGFHPGSSKRLAVMLPSRHTKFPLLRRVEFTTDTGAIKRYKSMGSNETLTRGTIDDLEACWTPYEFEMLGVVSCPWGKLTHVFAIGDPQGEGRGLLFSKSVLAKRWGTADTVNFMETRAADVGQTLAIGKRYGLHIRTRAWKQ